MAILTIPKPGGPDPLRPAVSSALAGGLGEGCLFPGKQVGERDGDQVPDDVSEEDHAEQHHI